MLTLLGTGAESGTWGQVLTGTAAPLENRHPGKRHRQFGVWSWHQSVLVRRRFMCVLLFMWGDRLTPNCFILNIKLRPANTLRKNFQCPQGRNSFLDNFMQFEGTMCFLYFDLRHKPCWYSKYCTSWILLQWFFFFFLSIKKIIFYYIFNIIYMMKLKASGQ